MSKSLRSTDAPTTVTSTSTTTDGSNNITVTTTTTTTTVNPPTNLLSRHVSKTSLIRNESNTSAGLHSTTSTSPTNKSVTVPSAATGIGGAVTLTFPSLAAGTASSQVLDLKSNLTSLTDDRSPYASVARSCLQLNQYAGSGSNAAGSASEEGVVSSSVFHDGSFASSVSSTVSALGNCASGHTDRRCRVLATKTLALFGRGVYARVRHSNRLFSVREGILGRIEDDVGGDVPVTLCGIALDDSDDGVSACALEALGMLTLSLPSGGGGKGSAEDDELVNEIRSVTSACASPYAPDLTCLQEEDWVVPQSELRTRIYTNVVPPRIRRLCHRVSLYKNPTHVVRTLPFLTGCLLHLVKVSPSQSLNTDRTTYAKRWYELDAVGLSDDFVRCILLPSMVDGSHSGLAHGAALSGLRLVNARPAAAWVSDVCRSAAMILTDALANAEITEMKCATLASLLVALRGLPVLERRDALTLVSDEIRHLPCTAVVPEGIITAAMRLEYGRGDVRNRTMYRRPVRVGLWAEVILSVMMDGPNPSNDGPAVRSAVLHHLLTGSVLNSVLTSRSSGKKKKKKARRGSGSSALSSATDVGGTSGGGAEVSSSEEFVGSHVAEEAVLTFCTVASMIGRRFMEQNDSSAGGGGGTNKAKSPVAPGGGSNVSNVINRDVEEWLRCSLVILSACSSCVNWRCRTVSPDSANGTGPTSESTPVKGSTTPPSSRATPSTGGGGSAPNKAQREEDDSLTYGTPCASARVAYAHLLQQCLHAVGLLSPVSSVSLHMMSNAVPPGMIAMGDGAPHQYHRHVQQQHHHGGSMPMSPASTAGPATSVLPSSTTPAVYGPSFAFAHAGLSTLTDQLVEYKLREGVPSRHLRVRLLALLADHWVQRCYVGSSFSASGPSGGASSPLPSEQGPHMNDMNAREILSMLATEISSLIAEGGAISSSSRLKSPSSSPSSSPAIADREEEESGHHSPLSSVAGGENMGYLQACVACVENIALTAYDWGRRYGSKKSGQEDDDNTIRAEIDEDSSYIVSVSMAVLKGQKLTNEDDADDASAGEDGAGGYSDRRKNSSSPSAVLGNKKTGSIVGLATERAGNVAAMLSECTDAATRIRSVLDSAAASDTSGAPSFFAFAPPPASAPPFSVLVSKIASGTTLSSSSGGGGGVPSTPMSGQAHHRGSGTFFRSGSLRGPGLASPLHQPHTPRSAAPPSSCDFGQTLAPRVVLPPKNPGRRPDGGTDADGEGGAVEVRRLFGDAYHHTYLCHYYRQVVASRVDASVLSSRLGDGDGGGGGSSQRHVRRTSNSAAAGAGGGVGPVVEHGGMPASSLSARPRNWLRLMVPPPPPSWKKTWSAASAAPRWSNSVTTVTGSSDPIALTLSYGVRRCPRYDGEVECKLAVTVRMYNVTAVPIMHGVRMDLSVVKTAAALSPGGGGGGRERDDIVERMLSLFGSSVDGSPTADEEDSVPIRQTSTPESSREDRATGRGEGYEELLGSATAVYKHEISPGDHVTWEVILDNWPAPSGGGGIDLRPSVTFREVETEQPTHRWVGLPAYASPSSRTNRGLSNVSEEDDDDDDGGFSAQESSGGGDEIFGSVEGTLEEGDETMDVTLTGERVSVPSMVALRPCPLVFFRDGRGDESAFRFLWSSLEHRPPPMALEPRRVADGRVTHSGFIGARGTGTGFDEEWDEGRDGHTTADAGRALADLSTVDIHADPGVYNADLVALRGWAFIDWSGKRVLCILSVRDRSLTTTSLGDGNASNIAGGERSGLMEIRGEDTSLLLSLMGTVSGRRRFVADLTGGAWILP